MLPTRRRCNWARWLVNSCMTACVVAASLAGTRCVFAQRPLLAEPPLGRRLQQRFTLAWNGQDFGSALSRLSEVQDLPLWVDRRVDSGAEITLSLDNLTLADTLDRIAEEQDRNWGWTSLRTVVYFGPRDAALELATLSELARHSLAKAPADLRRKWLTPGAWKFARLSEPRDLLAGAVEAGGAKLSGAESVPHDLWPARAIPAIAPIDRVVLLLAGFNLVAEISPDGRTVRPGAIKRPVQITRDYPKSDRIAAAVAELTASDDSIRVRVRGRQLTVSGRWEDHERLRRGQRGASSPDDPADEPAPAGSQRFTLRIANKPVGAVLNQLAAQLQLTLAWDPAMLAASPAIGETLVSCDVQDVDVDGLLAAVLAPAGLTFVRDGQTVTIRAAP